MATYFYGDSNSEVEADGVQTLYLMNSDNTNVQLPHNQNMFLFNPASAANALNPSTVTHALTPNPHHHHHLIGFPMVPHNSENPTRPSLVVPSQHVQRYISWPGQNLDQAGSSSHELGFRRPVASSMRQGLSLSLSPRPMAGRSMEDHHHDIRMSGNSVSPAPAVSSGVSSSHGVVMGSKYLKAAQELLDEVVNVNVEGTINKEKGKINKESSPEVVVAAGEGSGCGGESKHGGSDVELSTAQRQELQTKKAKLISMLDEVEQRYKQYHHQMQVAVSSFEQVAGIGTAKSYTSLALQTISKQFRCLKDAIMGQIKATSKSLGKEDCIGAKVEGSRLRYVDHQLRQQRALQQLGMIQNNAWRPQRGLPERAVSVLRAWLFEHFLHPYPKDSDKIILAKQTGLTRSQVSNWFINARVRLWKPMVEEMYLEEIKEKELENHNKSEIQKPQEKGIINHEEQQMEALQSKQIVSARSTHHHQFSNSLVMSSGGISLEQQTTFNLIGSPSSDLEMIAQASENKSISPSKVIASKFNERGFSLITGTSSNNVDEFGTYGIGEFTPRFGQNNVSLTLGLPRDNSEQNSLSNTQPFFLSNQNMELGRAVEPDFCGISNPTTEAWL
ncbi:hypothetical protein ACFE04_016571 [Oxalis oulophora]